MVEIWLPYGTTDVPVRVKDETLRGLHQIQDSLSLEAKVSAIEDALDKPLGTQPLVDLLRGRKSVAVAVNRIPDARIEGMVLDAVIRRAREAQIEPSSMRAIVCDPWSIGQASRAFDDTDTEDVTKNVLQGVRRESISYESVGDFSVDSDFAGADAKIVVGFVSANSCTGWDGAWSCLAPGLLEPSDKVELLRQAGNPSEASFQSTLLRLVRRSETKVEVDFEIDCIPGSDPLVPFLFAGKPQTVHKEVDAFLTKNRLIEAKNQQDAVIMSPGGTPFDGTLFSSLDALMCNAELLRRNGTALLVAACDGGYGPPPFYDLMRERLEASEISRRYGRTPDIVTLKTLLLTRFMSSSALVLVSTLPDYYVHHVFRMRSSKTASGALLSAERTLEELSALSVIRHASAFVSRLPSEQP